MNIQWYPGHMAKTKRQIQESLKLIDVVVELFDARIPSSSRNPDLVQISQKPRVAAAAKWDLADPKRMRLWSGYWKNNMEKIVALDLIGNKGLGQLKAEIINKAPGLNRDPRVLVVGIPNVGKSTLINRLMGRASARVGAKPGVTRGKQWIKAAGFQLLDTPGILWPKFEDPAVGYRLAAVAAIRDEVVDPERLTLWLLQFLGDHYFSLLERRYGLAENNLDVAGWMQKIGRKRGCLLPGGIVDLRQTAELVLKEFRGGIIGRVTLELP